ncbi:hypothetical protein ATER59S_02457 [Aquamicrobium terrae]
MSNKFGIERDYLAIAEKLVPDLHGLPGKVVAIGGRPGVGKTSLGRFLAYHFNVSLIETDMFLVRGQGRLVYFDAAIAHAVMARIDSRRPVIVEGVVILQVLDRIGRRPDFEIYVENPDAPESEGDLWNEIVKYEQCYSPERRANLRVHFTGCD